MTGTPVDSSAPIGEYTALCRRRIRNIRMCCQFVPDVSNFGCNASNRQQTLTASTGRGRQSACRMRHYATSGCRMRHCATSACRMRHCATSACLMRHCGVSSCWIRHCAMSDAVARSCTLQPVHWCIHIFLKCHLSWAYAWIERLSLCLAEVRNSTRVGWALHAWTVVIQRSI
jgi:hypothetical protein